MTQNAGGAKTVRSVASRREFLRRGGKVTLGAVLAGAVVPAVHAGEDNTIRLALIGTGGRGGGAVANALSAPGGPVQLYAMADLKQNRMESSYTSLKNQFGEKVDVPESRRFLGFDAYQKAIDCLQPGDVAMLTAFAYCRPTHLEYAVRKGVNVFMEKSFAADPGGLHRMLRAGEEADKKNLKIAAGLMCRHSTARQEMIARIRDGAMGELQLIRASRMWGGGGIGKRNPNVSELMWQIDHRGAFLWVTSGNMIEMLIHQIDECCWLKDSWPVAAHGLGGRVPRSTDCGQNLDIYAMEYTFADGTKALVNSRSISKSFEDFATYVHGTKCAAQFSGNIHAPTVHAYKDQRIDPANIDWRAAKEPDSPWQAE
ncbi:MAG: gfo/Idh/MocA family oxidoreductase, partial [Planctomycetes bacterium]|nr:gfo/Idh/MocA family oxidoreductase [Planctomycetota bacterium]